MKAWQIYIICVIGIPFLVTFFLEPVGTISDYDYVSALTETALIGGIILTIYYLNKRQKAKKSSQKESNA